MATNPKLEFYKFQLVSKEGKEKTFRDFAIEELSGNRAITNDEAFKLCFMHFIQTLESKHAKNDKKKKTITIIENSKTNPYLHLKPIPIIKKNLITGVINGGPYDKDAIVSDLANKEDNTKLGRNKSVLLPYFILLYLPTDYSQGFFAIHSNSTEETVTTIFRSYVSNLFSGNNYYKAIPEAFCPKSFQNEFKKEAIIKNLTFSTTVIDNTHSTDPIRNLLKEYNIKIEATPKRKSISITEAQKVLDFFKKKVFVAKKDKPIELDDFNSKKLVVENDVTKKQKVFEWSAKDNEFVPAVFLEGRVKIVDGTPDFEDLKTVCINIFESEILNEIRPDLNVSKIR